MNLISTKQLCCATDARVNTGYKIVILPDGLWQVVRWKQLETTFFNSMIFFKLQGNVKLKKKSYD